MVELANTVLREQNDALERERQRSERLLLNVLPATIAGRMKESSAIIAEHFEEVSVLFADITGFTQLSASVQPRELVRILDAIFSEFDALAERHGLEKIKTIGDCYMAVAGLPVPQADHVEAVAEMALSMQHAVARVSVNVNTPLAIRVGIHTGEVVAGVIGKKKFAYDLWGDTVNMASRMESHGLPGAVHCTEAVEQRLSAKYDFERREPIHVKGKGITQTYLLTGRKPGHVPLRASLRPAAALPSG
jgi:class 3 adenylate cyclase